MFRINNNHLDVYTFYALQNKVRLCVWFTLSYTKIEILMIVQVCHEDLTKITYSNYRTSTIIFVVPFESSNTRQFNVHEFNKVTDNYVYHILIFVYLNATIYSPGLTQQMCKTSLKYLYLNIHAVYIYLHTTSLQCVYTSIINL